MGRKRTAMRTKGRWRTSGEGGGAALDGVTEKESFLEYVPTVCVALVFGVRVTLTLHTASSKSTARRCCYSLIEGKIMWCRKFINIVVLDIYISKYSIF